MHPFLKRDAAGEVSIRWRNVILALVVYVLVSLAVGALFRHFLGVRFRSTLVTFSIFASALPSLLLLYLAKRHAEGKSARQFTLSALLAGTTVACVLLALLGSDRRADLANDAGRARLQEAIRQLVGAGHVHVSTTTHVQIQNPSFDDDDLEELIRLKTDLDDVDAPLTFLDLSGTEVSDRGIARLATVDSLQYCFLERTAATDASVDAIGGLPNLKVLSLMSTRATPERLLKLSEERPQLNIEPKTYQRLKR